MQIYPNPSNNLVNINSQELISKITITNSLGEVVFKKYQDQSFLIIYVSSFLNNLYILKVMFGDKEKIEKLIVEYRRYVSRGD
tara:strand:- start:1535 stop:1783 length:249 start_codon:yes stop_codon:yes gene_type:complete